MCTIQYQTLRHNPSLPGLLDLPVLNHDRNNHNVKPMEYMYWYLAIRRRSDYIIGFVTPAIGPNKFKKLTRLIAPVHNIRGKVWMKSIIHVHGFTDNKLVVCEAMCAVFHSNFAA